VCGGTKWFLFMSQLHSVTFYPYLIGHKIGERNKGEKTVELKTTSSHALIYGAILAHDSGPHGCIASNEKIGEETGLSAQTVANCLVDMVKLGWIVVNLSEKKRRTSILPVIKMSVLKVPEDSRQREGTYRQQEPSLPTAVTQYTASGNIDNILDIHINNIVEEPTAKSKKIDYSNQDKIIHYFYSKIAPSTAYGTRLSKGARESATLMLQQYSESEVCSAVDKLLQLCSSGVEQFKYVSRFESFANKIQVYAGVPKPKVNLPMLKDFINQEYNSMTSLNKELYRLYFKHKYGVANFNQTIMAQDEDFMFGGYPENVKTIELAKLDLNRLCGIL
jgi:nitrate reductase cytochrome c-type subunit